jgi:CRISPR/Cas system-associated protein endoribonuclease Cas2
MTEQEEKDRAFRIAFMTEGFHLSVTSIYEKLVDREYDSATEDIKSLMRDLRATIKLIEDDDF